MHRHHCDSNLPDNPGRSYLRNPGPWPPLSLANQWFSCKLCIFMFQLSSQNQRDRAESNAYAYLQTKTRIFQFNTMGLKEHLLYSVLALRSAMFQSLQKRWGWKLEALQGKAVSAGHTTGRCTTCVLQASTKSFVSTANPFQWKYYLPGV